MPVLHRAAARPKVCFCWQGWVRSTVLPGEQPDGRAWWPQLELLHAGRGDLSLPNSSCWCKPYCYASLPRSLHLPLSEEQRAVQNWEPGEREWVPGQLRSDDVHLLAPVQPCPACLRAAARALRQLLRPVHPLELIFPCVLALLKRAAKGHSALDAIKARDAADAAGAAPARGPLAW